MKLHITERARNDIKNAIHFYNEQKEGLGNEFFLELVSTLKNIKDYPNAWQVFTQTTRRCLMNRFPYGIVYFVENDVATVILVAHLHRAPEVWKSRIDEM